MAFLKWLFGRSSTKGWTVSENGSPMLVDGSTRITVFPQDRGWKFCIADVEDRTEPYFSDAYSSEQDAREEAIAYYREEPPRHQPLSASSAESRRERWEAQIRERTNLIEEIRQFLSETPIWVSLRCGNLKPRSPATLSSSNGNSPNTTVPMFRRH